MAATLLPLDRPRLEAIDDIDELEREVMGLLVRRQSS
jgi:hypothetical protein